MTYWKPFDVAMVECSDGKWRRAFYDPAGRPSWVFANGLRRFVDDSAARPVVVIDPEDREQVAALLSHYHSWKWTAEIAEASITDMQTSLRESANPKPRIEEPTGLGAVVEDEYGDLWIRDKTTTTVAHWKRARGEDGGRRYRWSDLDVARVIQPGTVIDDSTQDEPW